MKRFVYLVQTKRELPYSLQGLYGPDSDVIFLSWEKATDHSTFFPFSTWSNGRNRLFKKVYNTDYRYYIFLDDDVVLETTKLYRGEPKNPWRIFEEYLLRYEPAVGATSYHFHLPLNNEKIQTIYAFDPLVTAIHKEALDVLLPYCDLYDHISWWNSFIFVMHLAAVLYKSHVLQFNILHAKNMLSRSYQRSNKFYKELNTIFYNSLISPELKKIFKPFYNWNNFPMSINVNGVVEYKKQSYHYSVEELSHLFDFQNPYWKRKFALMEHISGARSYFSVYGLLHLPYMGEFIHKHAGTKRATLIFSPLCTIRSLWKNPFSHLCKYLDKAVHYYRRIQYYLKTPQELPRLLRQRLAIHVYKKHISFTCHQHGNIALHKYRAIYFFIPKVACTSLKAVCVDLVYAKGKQIFIEIDPRLPYEARYHNIPLPYVPRNQIYKYRNYFKFCFVRNPWDRIVSCYCEKIENQNFNKDTYPNAVYNCLVKYGVFKDNMSFDEFVYAIKKIPDNEADTHFKSQYSFIAGQHGELLVDFIGKFENLEEDFKKIAKRLGFSMIKLPHKAQCYHRHYSTYYTNETRQIIAERFKKDIEMFGYQFEIY